MPRGIVFLDFLFTEGVALQGSLALHWGLSSNFYRPKAFFLVVERKLKYKFLMFYILFCVVDTWVYTIVKIHWVLKICIVLLYENHIISIKTKTHIFILKLANPLYSSWTASEPSPLSTWVFNFLFVFAPEMAPYFFAFSAICSSKDFYYIFLHTFLVFCSVRVTKFSRLVVLNNSRFCPLEDI